LQLIGAHGKKGRDAFGCGTLGQLGLDHLLNGLELRVVDLKESFLATRSEEREQ
jgi:hypothetical protein